MLIRSLLDKYGLNVEIVDNGQDAVNSVEAGEFDLIFMDLQMPVMGGLKAAELIKSKSKKIPIIALTANALKGDREKCLKAGCDDYLPKPIDRPDLIDLLKKYLYQNQTLPVS